MSAVRFIAALLLALAAPTGCGRPTGDFGRAAPSVIHDDLAPELGRIIAEERREEPVSRFNLTDTERELRDRAFAFVRPPHLGDWWLATLVEGQRTRVLPTIDPTFNPGRYYVFLSGDHYRSSEARWSKVIEDVQGDALLVPPFCDVAARVRRADAERLAALGRQDAVPAAFVEDAYDRVYENDEVMAWVWRALGYRLASYRIAIDRLEVETPSDRLFETNQAFLALAASRCTEAPPARLLPVLPARPSRTYRGPDPFDEPVLQK